MTTPKSTVKQNCKSTGKELLQKGDLVKDNQATQDKDATYPEKRQHYSR
jgi:uncharacterized phosphosugar-binding protein